jgi:dolichol-phosphate mannosyltransferase
MAEAAAGEAGGPRFSIVVAVFNEAENVAPVTAEILGAARPLGDFELIYVDDGSSDETPKCLRVLRARHGAIRVLRHDRRCGKTAALITGITAARAGWIVTMDGDGQDDAAEIPRLLELARGAGDPSPLVAGIRTTRRDRW